MDDQGEDDPRMKMLTDMLDGVELSVLCVVLALHDKGLISKDDVAFRLRDVARAMQTSSDLDEDRKSATTYPMRRLAAALEKSQVIRQGDGKDER